MAAQPLIIISKPPEMAGRKARGLMLLLTKFRRTPEGICGGQRRRQGALRPNGRRDVPSSNGSPAAGYFASEQFMQRKEESL